MCPHSRSPRSGVGFPCPSCRGAQGTARGRKRKKRERKTDRRKSEEVESGESRIKERQPPHTWMDMEMTVKGARLRT